MNDFNETPPQNRDVPPPVVEQQIVGPYQESDPSPPPVEKQHDTSSLPRLVGLLVLLSVVAISPFLAGQVQYHLTRGRMRAEVEMATEALDSLAPQMQNMQLASRMVAKRVAPSVVNVHRTDARRIESQASGVIVDEAGYIVTNDHVVANANSLHVRLSDGRTVPAELVGADPAIDLAVLKIEAGDLIAAEWGDSDSLDVGDLVWALGSPFGLDATVTFGIVSAKNRRSSSGVTESLYQEFLQTDVAINPGNSGGPLVDLQGRVVGINTMIVGESYRGISFAVPTNLARKTYRQLIENGEIKRGYLGVRPLPVPDEVRTRLGLNTREGVYVGLVEQPSPASRAGLRVGDVILSWNNGLANDPTLLSRAIADTEIGTDATMRIVRAANDGPREIDLTVTVGGRPRLARPVR